MFVVFRCDCGKFLYCKDFLKSHECAYCGKVLRVGGRRVLCRSEDVEVVREFVSVSNGRVFGNSGFVRADRL